MPKADLHVVGGNDVDEHLFGRPLQFKLSKIVPYVGQPRKTFIDSEIKELADSIQERGQDTPVKLRKHPTENGVFMLIGGERRVKAFHLIWERTGKEPLVDGFIATVKDDEDHFVMAFTDNLQREDLAPVDEAASYARLKNEYRYSVAKIARTAKKAESHVNNYILMHERLCDEVKELMSPNRPKNKILGTGSAIDIAKSVTNASIQISIARETVENGYILSEVHTLIEHRTGNRPTGFGRPVKPSDVYKKFGSFLGRSTARVLDLNNNLDVDAMYTNRDLEDDDREFDARRIKQIIGALEGLLKKVEKKDK